MMVVALRVNSQRFANRFVDPLEWLRDVDGSREEGHQRLYRSKIRLKALGQFQSIVIDH
jgi:hypothetical protein